MNINLYRDYFTLDFKSPFKAWLFYHLIGNVRVRHVSKISDAWIGIPEKRGGSK